MIDMDKLFNEIRDDEGVQKWVYLCSELEPTVGVGHRIRDADPEAELQIFDVCSDDVPKDQCISDERIRELFETDVAVAIETCEKIYSNWDELPQEAQHVLCNMSFQLGEGTLRKFVGMNAAAAEQDFAEMAKQMIDSRWARQTPERAQRLERRVLALI